MKSGTPNATQLTDGYDARGKVSSMTDPIGRRAHLSLCAYVANDPALFDHTNEPGGADTTAPPDSCTPPPAISFDLEEMNMGCGVLIDGGAPPLAWARGLSPEARA